MLAGQSLRMLYNNGLKIDIALSSTSNAHFNFSAKLGFLPGSSMWVMKREEPGCGIVVQSFLDRCLIITIASCHKKKKCLESPNSSHTVSNRQADQKYSVPKFIGSAKLIT